MAEEEAHECQDLKVIHDNCFYKWYWEKFLPGKAEPEQPCEKEFAVYRECLKGKLKDVKVDGTWVMDLKASAIKPEERN